MNKADRYFENAATTAALIDAGIDMMRQNIRRRQHGATDATVDAILVAWLRRQNDSLPGDIAGQVQVRKHF